MASSSLASLWSLTSGHEPLLSCILSCWPRAAHSAQLRVLPRCSMTLSQSLPYRRTPLMNERRSSLLHGLAAHSGCFFACSSTPSACRSILPILLPRALAVRFRFTSLLVYLLWSTRLRPLALFWQDSYPSSSLIASCTAWILLKTSALKSASFSTCRTWQLPSDSSWTL